MDKDQEKIASEQRGDAATCGPSPGLGCSAFVRVCAVAPFWRYAVGPTSAHSPAIPFYTLKAAMKLYEEMKRELPWAGAILYKRVWWRGIDVVMEYVPNTVIPKRATNVAYRKSISALKKDRKREWSRRAVAAKARKRIERTESMRDVGGFTTDGIFVAHTIRFLSYGDGELHYAITVDGKHRQARTERGILRCLARMVYRKAAK